MNKEALKNTGGWALFIGGFLLVLYLITQVPPDNRNYEVHGADGKVYYTKSIAHGTGRIWFTDENGSRIELGGGYSVIEK